jgi:hypothetical protein
MTIIDERFSHILEEGLRDVGYEWRHKQAFWFLGGVQWGVGCQAHGWATRVSQYHYHNCGQIHEPCLEIRCSFDKAISSRAWLCIDKLAQANCTRMDCPFLDLIL